MGRPIELKLILNGTFAYVDRLADFQELLASEDKTKLFVVRPSPYGNSRDRFGGLGHQGSAQTYLDLKAAHFALLHQNCWFLLLSGDFATLEDYERAEQVGCRTLSDYTALREAGFEQASEMAAAKLKGFQTKAEMTRALGLGCQSAQELKFAVEGKFDDPVSFRQAWEKGIPVLAERLLDLRKTSDYRYEPTADQFVVRPVTLSNQRIVVDGSNVAWAGRSESTDERPSLQNVLRVVGDLFAKGFVHIQVFFDANISYDVSDAAVLEKLKNIAEVQVVPAGNQADEFVLNYSEKYAARIVSNDRYVDYDPKSGWLASNRDRLLVPFEIRETAVTYPKPWRTPPEGGTDQ